MNNGKHEHENTQETQKPPEQTEATPSTPTSPNFTPTQELTQTQSKTQFTPTQELTQTQSKTQWRCPCMLPTEEGGQNSAQPHLQQIITIRDPVKKEII
jgi:hypothetical protein